MKKGGEKGMERGMEKREDLLEHFPPEERGLLGAFLFDYQAAPTFKRILSSMLKFSDMYRPISKGSMDMFRDTGYVDAINAERRIKRAELSLAKKDLVLSYDESQGKRLVVTSLGHRVFYEDFPLARLRREKWKGIWTVVMYDIPEKMRERRRLFRRKLVSLGFGALQESILISPLSIAEGIQKLIEGEWLEREVWVMRARRVLGMENREVAQKAWPVIPINSLYRTLLQIYSRAEKEGRLDEWVGYFLAVDHADPYLPLELLPPDWLGRECEERFRATGRTGLWKAVGARLSLTRKREWGRKTKSRDREASRPMR